MSCGGEEERNEKKHSIFLVASSTKYGWQHYTLCTHKKYIGHKCPY